MKDNWKEEFDKKVAANKQRIKELFEHDMFDEDGYPTEQALEIVNLWHWDDIPGWFKFIKELWWSPDMLWTEKTESHDYKKDKSVHRYYISTGGWSGNESIIHAMQKSEMNWHLTWVQSRRGGHYIFEEYLFGGD